MNILFSVLGLLAAFAVQADTLSLPQPTALQVIGVQCGQPPVVNTATGFSGAYATTFAEATTRCPVGGRGGRTRTYHGCETFQYTLAGKLASHANAECSPQDAGAIYTNDIGYSERSEAGHAILELPAVTPSYTWQGADAVIGTIGQPTSFPATLVNSGSVRLHVYRFDAQSATLSAQFDPTNCTEVDLEPGSSCVVAIDIFPNNESGTETVSMSALTSSLTESTFIQTVTVQEAPEPPPPPPAATVTVEFGAGDCDALYLCTLNPTTTEVVTSGTFDLGNGGAFTVYNADGLLDIGQLSILTALVPNPDGSFTFYGKSMVLDGEGEILKTNYWTVILAVEADGVTLDVLGGTLVLAQP